MTESLIAKVRGGDDLKLKRTRHLYIFVILDFVVELRGWCKQNMNNLSSILISKSLAPIGSCPKKKSQVVLECIINNVPFGFLRKWNKSDERWKRYILCQSSFYVGNNIMLCC